MQKNSTMDLGLGGQREQQDWAAAGCPQHCAEIINRCREEEGLDNIGLASLTLPSEFSASLEYLQLISEKSCPVCKEHPIIREGNSYRRRRL